MHILCILLHLFSYLVNLEDLSRSPVLTLTHGILSNASAVSLVIPEAVARLLSTKSSLGWLKGRIPLPTELEDSLAEGGLARPANMKIKDLRGDLSQCLGTGIEWYGCKGQTVGRILMAVNSTLLWVRLTCL